MRTAESLNLKSLHWIVRCVLFCSFLMSFGSLHGRTMADEVSPQTASDENQNQDADLQTTESPAADQSATESLSLRSILHDSSASVSTVFSEREIDAIPLDRSLSNVIRLVPGITGVRINTINGTPDDGPPSIRGEGQYGNNYLLDGLSIRDPFDRVPAVGINFGAIESIEVITDPFNPEYGPALGGIVRIETKSGGDRYSGEAGWLFSSDRLDQPEGSGFWREDTRYTEHQPYFFIGGPIVKEHLRFFLAYDRLNRTEPVDDLTIYGDYPPTNYTLEGGDSETVGNSGFLKLSWDITSNNLLTLSGFMGQSRQDNLGIEERRQPDARYAQVSESNLINLSFESRLSDRTSVEIRAGFLDRSVGQESSSGNTSRAQYENIDTDVIWNNSRWLDKERTMRRDVSFTAHHILDWLGGHDVAIGFGTSRTKAGQDIDIYGEGEDIFPGDGIDDGTWWQFESNSANPDFEPQPLYFYEGNAVTSDDKSKYESLFIQDEWTVSDRFKIMAGFRMDPQYIRDVWDRTIVDFHMNDMFSPRLTVTIDMDQRGMNRIRTGVGRFYDTVSHSLLEWLTYPTYVYYQKYKWWGPTGASWEAMNDEQRNQALHDRNNWGDYQGNTGNSNNYYTSGGGDGARIDFDPSLKPEQQDRFFLEFTRTLRKAFTITARYVESHSRNLIEDVGILDENGYSYFRAINWDVKKRDYKAYEFEFTGRPTTTTTSFFTLSYVYSNAKGTNPGQFERGGYQSPWGSSNYIGVFGDHSEGKDVCTGLGGDTYGDEGWYGYLPYSVDHQVRFRGYWMVPLGMTIGTVFEWNSGYHWSKRGWVGAYEYSSFPDGRGTREMPDITYWDLSLEKFFTLGQESRFGLRLDAYNVLNADTPISYVQKDNEQFGQTLKRQNPQHLVVSARFQW